MILLQRFLKRNLSVTFGKKTAVLQESRDKKQDRWAVDHRI